MLHKHPILLGKATLEGFFLTLCPELSNMTNSILHQHEGIIKWWDPQAKQVKKVSIWLMKINSYTSLSPVRFLSALTFPQLSKFSIQGRKRQDRAGQEQGDPGKSTRTPTSTAVMAESSGPGPEPASGTTSGQAQGFLAGHRKLSLLRKWDCILEKNELCIAWNETWLSLPDFHKVSTSVSVPLKWAEQGNSE